MALGRAISYQEKPSISQAIATMPASLFTGEPISERSDEGVDSRWNGGGHG